MTTTLEDCYAALFARLQSAYAWKTTSRRLKHWGDVPPESQPAMFLQQKTLQAMGDTNKPTKWTLPVDVYVYLNAPEGDPAGEPSTRLNAAIQAIISKMKPDFAAQENQTLGGLVHYARIEGMIETDEGTLGDQSVAIIPIAMLTPVL